MGIRGKIHEKLFRYSDRDRFQRVMMRAGGDGNYPDGSNWPGGGAHLRDAWLHNLCRRGNMNLDFRINEKIYKVLMDKLANTILPETAFDIDMSWAGIMAFGKTKTPIVKNVSENVLIGVRLGGMGVAIGSKLGEKLAQMALGHEV